MIELDPFELTPEEMKSADNIPPHLVHIINEEGVTRENIDRIRDERFTPKDESLLILKELLQKAKTEKTHKSELGQYEEALTPNQRAALKLKEAMEKAKTWEKEQKKKNTPPPDENQLRIEK